MAKTAKKTTATAPKATAPKNKILKAVAPDSKEAKKLKHVADDKRKKELPNANWTDGVNKAATAFVGKSHAS